MSTIFRKTAKGTSEVETRANRLPPRLRAALILVDGRRNEDDLAKLVAADAAQVLRSLLEDGYIEAAAAAPARPAAPPPAPAVVAAAASPATSGPGLLSMPPSVIAHTKRDAVRMLTEQVGPMADALAMKIEKASNGAELQGLLEIGRQILGNTRGRAAADAFAQRFLAAAATAS